MTLSEYEINKNTDVVYVDILSYYHYIYYIMLVAIAFFNVPQPIIMA